MKKTLVALAVLATAGSVQAVELYNQDKVTVNMTGDIEVRYKKAETPDAEFQQEIDDADFGFDTRYMVNDDLQVGAYWEFDGSNVNSSTVVGDVYMALYSNTVGSIKFGKLATQLDDAGIGSDYAFGLKSFINDANLGSDETVRYDIDKGNFYGGLGYSQNKQGGAKRFTKDGSLMDLKIGARVADFDFTGFYGKASDVNAADNSQVALKDETLWALEARWSGVENLNLELGYYNANADFAVASVKDTSDYTVGLAADYTYNAWKFAAGVSQTKYDTDQGDANTSWDSQTGWFLNAGYALAPSTTAFVEVGGNTGYTDTDSTAATKFEKNGTGVAIGLKAEF